MRVVITIDTESKGAREFGDSPEMRWRGYPGLVTDILLATGRKLREDWVMGQLCDGPVRAGRSAEGPIVARVEYESARGGEG